MTFTMDAQHITRNSKDGELKLAWAEIKAVHRYSQVYLVDKGDGAMPLPYRCFSNEQRVAFEALLRQLLR